MFQTGINQAPFANLFYARAIFEYLFVHQVNEAMNPGYLRRYEQSVRRNTGQTFWLSPSTGQMTAPTWSPGVLGDWWRLGGGTRTGRRCRRCGIPRWRPGRLPHLPGSAEGGRDEEVAEHRLRMAERTAARGPVGADLFVGGRCVSVIVGR